MAEVRGGYVGSGNRQCNEKIAGLCESAALPSAHEFIQEVEQTSNKIKSIRKSVSIKIEGAKCSAGFLD